MRNSQLWEVSNGRLEVQLRKETRGLDGQRCNEHSDLDVVVAIDANDVNDVASLLPLPPPDPGAPFLERSRRHRINLDLATVEATTTIFSTGFIFWDSKFNSNIVIMGAVVNVNAFKSPTGILKIFHVVSRPLRFYLIFPESCCNGSFPDSEEALKWRTY